MLPGRLFTSKFDKTTKAMCGVEYWRVHGGHWPLVFRSLAQAVFAAPASSACVERDVCMADMFVPRKRGSLDPAFSEMSLYLRGQIGSIPLDIPKLSDDAMEDAIPNRLTDPEQLAKVEVLDFSPDPADEIEEEDLSCGGLSSGEGAQATPTAAGGS